MIYHAILIVKTVIYSNRAIRIYTILDCNKEHRRRYRIDFGIDSLVVSRTASVYIYDCEIHIKLVTSKRIIRILYETVVYAFVTYKLAQWRHSWRNWPFKHWLQINGSAIAALMTNLSTK